MLKFRMAVDKQEAVDVQCYIDEDGDVTLAISGEPILYISATDGTLGRFSVLNQHEGLEFDSRGRIDLDE